MKLILALIIIGGMNLHFQIMKINSSIKTLEKAQKELDNTLSCVIAIQWKQDENLIKAYTGTEPTWQGHRYEELEECKGVLYE